MYGGTRNPRTGQKILSGFTPGGEGEAQGWGRWITGAVPGDKETLLYASPATSSAISCSPIHLRYRQAEFRQRRRDDRCQDGRDLQQL